MLVQQILARKPSHDIVFVSQNSTVSEAAGLLSQNRIGALVVSEDGQKVDGMFSERDVVRELGRRGVACMSDCVRDLMTREITTCTRADKSDSVLKIMTEGRFRHLPVVEEGALVGLISIGDVVLARISEVEMENQALEGMIKGF